MKEKAIESGYPNPPVVVMVSPEMATTWLEANTHNRPVLQTVVDMYSRDMKLNRWVLTHQGIAFDVSGRLVDGQHRLWAVIDSGVTVPMLVHRGLPMESQVAIDTGKTRASVDRLGLSDKFGQVTSREANILKRLIRGGGPYVRLSCQDEQDLFARHVAAIRFSISAFPGRRAFITRSEVYAVAARAYYNCDRDEIKRFCHVVLSNEAKRPQDKTAILLRDFLLTSRGQKPDTIYLKTSAALRAFIDGKKLIRLYPASEEHFALPEEKGRIKQYATRSPRNYDLIDRVMAYMRSHKRSSTSDLAKSLDVTQTMSVKKACDECVRLGWLEAEKSVLKGSRSASSIYRISASS